MHRQTHGQNLLDTGNVGKKNGVQVMIHGPINGQHGPVHGVRVVGMNKTNHNHESPKMHRHGLDKTTTLWCNQAVRIRTLPHSGTVILV